MASENYMDRTDQNLVYRYGSTNWNSVINNPKFATSVAIRIKDILKRPLSNQEINYVITKIKNLDAAYFKKMNISRPDDMVHLLANNVITDLQKFSNSQFQDIDTHELLKARIGTTSEDNSAFQYSEDQLNGFTDRVVKKEGFMESNSAITQFMGAADLAAVRKELNPEANQKHAYLVFDSKYRNPTFGPITNFNWVFVPNATTQTGSVNSLATSIRDVNYIKSYPIRIPLTPTSDSTLGRTTLNIEEFDAQSFIDKNRKYHFSYANLKSADGRWLDLIQIFHNAGKFKFATPITKIDSLTLNFGNPVNLITFPADRIGYSIAYGPILTIITTFGQHNLITGDLVSFSDFVTISPVADALIINKINSENGFYITFINATQFSISLNTSTLSPLPTSYIPTVYFESQRIIVNMEIGYLYDGK